MLELLLVIAVLATLSGLAVVSFDNMARAGALTRASTGIEGALETARAQAMARGTPVWLGLKNHQAGPEASILLAVVTSRGGETTPSQTTTGSPDSDLVQLGPLQRFKHVRLESVPLTTERPAAQEDARIPGLPAILSFSIAQGNEWITFDSDVIEFNGRGEARVLRGPGGLRSVIEVGVENASGPIGTGASNYAAVQISGLSGTVSSYRP